MRPVKKIVTSTSTSTSTNTMQPSKDQTHAQTTDYVTI